MKRSLFVLLSVIMILLTVFGYSVIDAEEESVSVTFSYPAGTNISDKELVLSVPEGYSIYYTLDGSDPDETSFLYSEPLTFEKTGSVLVEHSDELTVSSRFYIRDDDTLPWAVVVKAVAIDGDGNMGSVSTNTYFLQDLDDILTVSFVTDYDNLLDYDTGILVKGKCYDEWVQTITPEKLQQIISEDKFWLIQGNYTQHGREWERPTYMQLFDEGTLIAEENIGIRVRGATSRSYPQKSFNVYFRSDYGNKNLKYALFEDNLNYKGKLINKYKTFMLRNGGQGTLYLKFKDAMLQSLMEGLNVALQASRPCILFLNGEYMGIYSAMEKQDDKYFENHYGVVDSNVISVEAGEIDEGEESDIVYYNEYLSYGDKDFSDPKVYEEFLQIVDIDSLLDCSAAMIYIANTDWKPTRNYRIWRAREYADDFYGDTRWRFCIYDTELSSSMKDGEAVSWNYDTIAEVMARDKVFASLMTNPDFNHAFVERLKKVGSEYFNPDRVNEKMDEYIAIFEPHMENFYKRFVGMPELWDSNIAGTREFFEKRYDYIVNIAENNKYAVYHFKDVSDPDKYYFDPVYWAYNEGITTGTSKTTFSPDENCTREQVVTFLWRMMGEPEPESEAPFNDVPADKYFTKAVAWAYENEITTGVSKDRFGIGENCSRGMIVTFLKRYDDKFGS